MYRFLLTRQWVILTLVGLVLIPVMIKLGFWQLHRHESRVARNHQIGRQLSAAPVPVTELSTPGHDVPHQDVWRKITATGTYDTKGEVAVRYRTDDSGTSGFFVVTPLVLDNGQAVLVNRGWIPADSGQMKFPEVPAAPSGRVSLTGRLRADETTGSSGIRDIKGLPPRLVMLINSKQQAEKLHRTLLGGYIELASPTSDNQPKAVSPPDHSSIGNHMAYAVQWWLFSAFVPIGWLILVRRERRDQPAAAAAPAEAAQEDAPAPAVSGQSTAD